MLERDAWLQGDAHRMCRVAEQVVGGVERDVAESTAAAEQREVDDKLEERLGGLSKVMRVHIVDEDLCQRWVRSNALSNKLDLEVVGAIQADLEAAEAARQQSRSKPNPM